VNSEEWQNIVHMPNDKAISMSCCVPARNPQGITASQVSWKVRTFDRMAAEWPYSITCIDWRQAMHMCSKTQHTAHHRINTNIGGSVNGLVQHAIQQDANEAMYAIAM